MHSHGEQGHAAMTTEPVPRLVFWELTKGCNLRCIHCRASAAELSSPDDLPTRKVFRIIDQIVEVSHPILVLSGGEPLYRHDIFEIARYANQRGLRVALATNGTMVTKEVAQQIVHTGIKRVAISLDGADAATHDAFRGIPGAFDAALQGFRNLKELGMSVQINTTVARHNVHQLPKVMELARGIGADALHTFLLVPVGCGVTIAEEQMVPADEYERILNWFYDRSLEGEIELKATCAPHYFRVARQRRVEERNAERNAESKAAQTGHAEPHSEPTHVTAANAALAGISGIGPVDMAMPGTTGIDLNPQKHPGGPQPTQHGHPGGDPNSMNAMTKGCLAGSGVCFISYSGEVFPCGYLPVKAGDLQTQSFADIWRHSQVFDELRDTNNLKGKCGACEFRNICMGCRARAYGVTGDYLAEEPFCIYQPKTMKAQPSTEAVTR